MKMTMNVECTPEEARRFVGLPDVTPLNEMLVREMTSRADGSGWILSLAGRDSILMSASMSGDSLVLLSDPFESVLRDKVTVQARTATVFSRK